MQDLELLNRLSAIQRRFPEIEAIGYEYRENYVNAYRELHNALERVDRDVVGALMERVYKRQTNLDSVVDLGYFDRELTTFGEFLVTIRFAAGYAGNVSEGTVVGQDRCAVLMLAYECYWREGEDFLIGVVVENLLRRIPFPSQWKWPHESEFQGSEKARQFHALAREIALEMKTLARHHRLMQPGMEGLRTSDLVKPAFRDFRAMERQIVAAAKAVDDC